MIKKVYPEIDLSRVRALSLTQAPVVAPKAVQRAARSRERRETITK